MDNEQAARRLSAALGRRIDAEDIAYADDGGTVMTATGAFALAGGNVAYEPGVGWWRNGRRWTPDGVKLRPIS